MYGEKTFGRHVGFPTPTEIPDESTCLTLMIPADPAWWGIYRGLLLTLNDEENWQQFEGGIEREDAAAAATAIYLAAMELAEGETCGVNAPAPFWDDAEDVDDELPPDEEIWYGEVSDPEAPPEELTLIDNIAIWALTGFIAYSGQIGAAIFFHTIAPKFVLAFKAGDVGEVIRIVIDAVDYGRVDTTGHAGEIMTTPILPEMSETGHDIWLVKVAPI